MIDGGILRKLQYKPGMSALVLNAPDSFLESIQPLPGGHALTVHPLGYSEQEALFPYPLGSFAGFRLLQEYFAFPQRFQFVELAGLSDAELTQPGDLSFALAQPGSGLAIDPAPESGPSFGR